MNPTSRLGIGWKLLGVLFVMGVVTAAYFLGVRRGRSDSAIKDQTPAKESELVVLRRTLEPFQTILNTPIGEDEADNPKSAAGVRARKLEARLVEHPSEFDAALQFALTASDSKDEKLKDEVLYVVLMIVFQRHDDASLARLLSTVPITNVGRDYIEHALVAEYRGRKIDDFGMLFTAYDAATLPKVKQSLVAAIRRGLHDKVLAWYVDAQFVEDAKMLFEVDRENWKVNREYGFAMDRRDFWDGYIVVPPPLFIPIYGPDSVERKIRNRD